MAFMARLKRHLFVVLAAASLQLTGCASVPGEAVDLSRTLGQDIEALHQSHRDLVVRYFEALRSQVNDAIDQVYIPAYINDFVATGRLVQRAQNQRADLVEAWARLAVKQIDRERRERMQPLYAAERELVASIDEAFDRTTRANAAITAQLSSLVKTQRAQDDILESLKLKDLREKIHSTLAQASVTAEKITTDINNTSTKLQKR